jgi:acyl-CoA synthetase (NDP forming)
MSGPVSRQRLAQALFAPRSIALIGASGDHRKNTARPQRFLRRHGYSGAIYPINPGRDEVLGERAYPDLAAVGAPIDHAFVMVAAAHVPDAVEQCGSAGVPVATVYSDGFAESGPPGHIAQESLAAQARSLGVRLLGPNCIGLASVYDRTVLTANAVLESLTLRPGPVSIVSQSGSMMGAILSRGIARGFGFARMISVGNECDLAVGELVDLIADDPHTETIALFLETLRDAEQLALAARRAYAAGKRVVAYKLGRSPIGAAIAASHTGALACSDSAADAYFRAHGIVRVDVLETLLEIAPLLAGRTPPRRGAKTVAVVTTTGGGAAIVADRLGMLGLVVARPDDALVAKLAEQGVSIRKSPIIDLTLAVTSREYGAVLDALLEWPGCSAVLAVVGSSAQFHSHLAVEPIVQARRIPKPMLAYLAPDAAEALGWLVENRVAAFRTPEACADALDAYFRWREPAAVADSAPPVLSLPRSRYVNERAALECLGELGISTVRCVLACEPAFAHDIPYPVAVKVSSPDIAHKTELGGVTLGVDSDAGLLAAARSVLASARTKRPDARLEGVLVQPMVDGIGEAIVGYRHDPLVGPIVLVGTGGRLAELLRDTTVELAPVTHLMATAMIERVRGFGQFRGFRNSPCADLDALARAVVALSRLACIPGKPVEEAEINPLVVKAHGVVAVDALLIIRGIRPVET